MNIRSERILIWGDDYNSMLVYNELRIIHPHLSIVNIDKPFLTKLKYILNNDILYVISGKMGMLMIIAKLLGKRIIIHWVGTDLLKFHKSNLLTKILYRTIPTKHIFVSQSLMKEFPHNRNVFLFPIFRQYPLVKTDFKIKKEILTYIPENREDFYYGQFITDFFKKKKSYNLHVIGNSGTSFKKNNNIKFYGWIDERKINKLINKCSIYIRFVKHDGFPKLVVDNLYNYNFVIYNKPFPYTINCTPEESILNDVLTNIYKKHSLKKSNQKQHEYIEKLYSEFNYHQLLEVILAR